MVHRLEMVLYYTITLNIFEKWQAKTFYLKKTLLFVDKCMTYIAGMAHFKLHQ